MLADPHFAARQAIVRLAHPDFGEFAMHNVAPKLSQTPGSVRHVGPELGEHTDEIYREPARPGRRRAVVAASGRRHLRRTA